MIYLEFAFTLFLILFQIEGYSSIKEIFIAWVNCNLVAITTTLPVWKLIKGLFKIYSI